MKTISLRTLVREPLKVKRMTQVGMSLDQVKARLKLQQPDLAVWRRADFVLENKGSLAELRRKTRALWNFFYSARFQSFKAARA